MENITKIKEAEKITTEEYCSADCGAHTPVELTTGGCSSPIELTEEPTCMNLSFRFFFFSNVSLKKI